MKFSLIATVLNEEKSIKEFVESVINQARRPDELVVVDGGSRDSTFRILKEYSKKHKWIKAHLEKGCNIARGRNTAIKNAKHGVIMVFDAGCKIDKDNVKSMLDVFEKGYDVVYGNWVPAFENLKQEAMARAISPDIDKPLEKKRFFPSSKNMVFKKECWKKVGGYPEHLYTAEDTLFNLRLKDAGCRIGLAKKAVVYWGMRETYRKFWKQFYLYGNGDRQAGNIKNPHFNGMLNLTMVVGFWAWVSLLILLLFFKPLYSAAMFLFVVIYFLLTGIQMFLKTGKVYLLFHGTYAQTIKRLAYIFGVTFG